MWAAVKAYLTKLNAFRQPTNFHAVLYSHLIFLKIYKNTEII